MVLLSRLKEIQGRSFVSPLSEGSLATGVAKTPLGETLWLLGVVISCKGRRTTTVPLNSPILAAPQLCQQDLLLTALGPTQLKWRLPGAPPCPCAVLHPRRSRCMPGPPAHSRAGPSRLPFPFGATCHGFLTKVWLGASFPGEDLAFRNLCCRREAACL